MPNHHNEDRFIYTVGIQVFDWWPFFFRKFRVVHHLIEELGGHIRCALQFPSGGMLVVPGLDRKKFIIYSDYRDVYLYKQELARRQIAPAAEE